MAEWQPAPEEKPEIVEEQEDTRSDGMKAFLKETGDLWKEMEKGEKPPEEPKKEEPKPAEIKPEPPKIQESAVPREDTGFLTDEEFKALDPKAQRRITWLYGKVKENDRQWGEAQAWIKKQAQDAEALRKQITELKFGKAEQELDAAQLEVVDLFTPNSPNYNPTLGAQKLRELSQRDIELKGEKEAEVRRATEFQTALEQQDNNKVVQETVQILEGWASTRDYAQEGHPLYPHVVKWLRDAYQQAPEHVTVQQIVKRAEQVFDKYVQEHPEAVGKPGNGQAQPELQPAAPAPAQPRMTVSNVIGTQQRGVQAPQAPADKLNSRQREIAKKLGVSPEDYAANL